MKEQQSAGVGTRVLNFLVDTILIFILSYLLYKWWIFYVRYWGRTYYPYYMFFYGTLFVYYFLFEIIWLRTPGKWLTLTKVVRPSGKRPGFVHILLRSLLRLTIIDAFFIPLLNKTLHDKLSGTNVVEA